jgi:hypothetical protein
LILAPFLLTKEMTLIGLVIRNIGTQFTTYSEVREKLPLVIVGVSRIGTCSPSMASDIREFATMECCFKSVRGNCRLMELRLRKNIICKYRFATCYFGVELFLKNL